MAATGSRRRTCGACAAALPPAAAFCPACGKAAHEGDATPADAAPADAPTETAPPASTLSSSSASETASRFAPGTLLAERYRVVSLLGRGGMGEVYRAEDLKLGQTVALKFLPRAVAREAPARQRLYQEVRLGRQVSHPNVCRLYDVIEWEGQLFVTMEYIDGEDLASLLRRIGALPPAKVLQLARELCAGLAAAHGLGVVHRDLKPANIMIDGRGSARITDFGLAVLAEQAPEHGELAGTPLYMAPEQLRGEPASARSDLYALGLVLYEMLTGAPLFDGGTRPELLRQHERSRASDLAMSSGTGELALRRVVARCLEEHPEDRPPSIHAVIASLPGGDPLQAALDAGETPSPELVAAAEGSGELRPAVAAAALAVFLALVVASALLADRWGQVPGYIDVPEGPEALATRAGDLLRQVGVATNRAGDSAYGWDFDWARRRWIAEHGFDWWGRGRRMAPSPAFFWYRYSPESLDPFNGRERVSERDPPFDLPGMARLRLDAQGRLLALSVVPSRQLPEGTGEDPDWDTLLDATGLDAANLQEAEPEWTPPVGATSRRAWTATYPGQPDLPLRVEAAAAAGRPVWLEVVPPWMVAAREELPQGDASRRLWEATVLLRALLFLVLILAAALLARRNVRRGRGDRRGALRVALVIGSATLAVLLGRVDFVPAATLNQGITQLASGIFEAFVAWLFYLAIEPYLRRGWPRLMVGWHRLLAGKVQDARVGREVLLGLAAGGFLAATSGELAVAVRLPDIPYSSPLQMLGRFRTVVAGIFEGVRAAGVEPLFVGLVLLLAMLVLRRKALAVGGLWLVVFLIGGDWIFDLRYALAFKLLTASLMVLVVIRVGLLGIAAMSFATTLLDFPMTLDPSRWYFVHSLVPFLVLVALGGWAAWRALGEEPVLASWLADERLPS